MTATPNEKLHENTRSETVTESRGIQWANMPSSENPANCRAARTYSARP